MIAIIDYGMGNLRSVQKAFEFLGFDASITHDKQKLLNAEKLVLPGVGAFADAVANLKKYNLIETIKAEIAKGKFFLGICLGMQLMFAVSYENGVHKGLKLIPGEVKPFAVKRLKVPHMGWNKLIIRDNPLFKNGKKDQYVYFVHTYHAADVPDEYVLAESEYGYRFCAAAGKDNMYGLQFHPEKSGDIGLEILKRFGGLT